MRNVKVNYKRTGKGPHIFFFPGGGTNTNYYQSFTKALSANNTIIEIDYPGFGLSINQKPLKEIEEYADFMINSILQFGFSENYIVSHSMGCGISLRYVQRYPKLITKLAMISPMLEQLEGSTFAIIKRVLLNYLDSIKQAPTEHQRIYKVIFDNLRQSYSELKQLRMLTLNFDVPLEESDSTEKLIVLGKQDIIFPYSRQIELVKHLSNCTTISIEDSGHDSMFSRKLQLSEIITDFFKHKV